MTPIHYVLNKRDLGPFLESLLPFWGPVGEAEKSHFGHLRRPEDLARLNLTLVNTNLPPKALIFPQTETILTYGRGQDEAATPPPGDAQWVAFGVRPCDGRAFDALDSHFIDYLADDHYTARRRSAVLIGMGCPEPGPNCFCPSVGGGPFSITGLDVLLSDLGESYLIEVLTERGVELFAARSVGEGLLRPATDDELAWRVKVERRALEMIERAFKVEGLKECLEADAAEGVWQEIARRCIGCGVCAYFCPTCYCTLVYNDELRGSGRRVRTWTSCQFPKHIFQETGVNLRPTRASRIKRRVWDKFKEFPDRFGKIGCMGCGRCIEGCPVDLDIVEVVQSLMGRLGDLAVSALEAGGEAEPPQAKASEVADA